MYARYYSLNVPLRDGMNDETYEWLFKPIMDRVMQVYQPGAIVFQSGESCGGCSQGLSHAGAVARG